MESLFNAIDWVELGVFFSLLFFLAPILGRYMAHVFEGEKTSLQRFIAPIERFTYRFAGVDPREEMEWKEYLRNLLVFNLWGFLLLFALLLVQGWLPFNPQQFPNVPWALAFNIAVSFVTNTDWQSYAGETTLSYTSQMTGLTVQNFLSAATGLATVLVMIRGFCRNKESTVGNFWVDIVRAVLYVLLPLSIIVTWLLISQGVIQSLSPYIQATTLENAPQTIPMGPVASQEAIELLGTNGGGFFNTKNAHPFANPTAFSNFISTLCLLLLPASLTYTFGILVGARRQGLVLYFVMLILWCGSLVLSYAVENIHDPVLGVNPLMEGKEVRFGVANSLLFATATTATSNGSVNAMMSSLSPLAGGIALFNMLTSEVIFGGLGVGLSGMLMIVLLTVFLAGLMVGRIPEYLGKKIDRHQIQWAMVAVLIPGFLILIGAGCVSLFPLTQASLGHEGPHGLTEILFAFASTVFNNGSAFASLNANTDFYNLTLGVIMLLGRLFIIVPSLAIAGNLVRKRIIPASAASFSTDTPMFAFFLMMMIVLLGALFYLPALSLGPIVEHCLMMEGRSF